MIKAELAPPISSDVASGPAQRPSGLPDARPVGLGADHSIPPINPSEPVRTGETPSLASAAQPDSSPPRAPEISEPRLAEQHTSRPQQGSSEVTVHAKHSAVDSSRDDGTGDHRSTREPPQESARSIPPPDLEGIESDDTISLYFREVGSIPLLTAEEEIDLAKRIEHGRGAAVEVQSAVDGNGALSREELRELEQVVADGEAARSHLTRANSRLVISMAKRYVNQGVPFLDLIQEGNLGLMRAVEKFDWRRGNKFSTYATWWVRQAITRALADQGRTIRVPVHMSDRIRRLFATARRLEQVLGREPTVKEMAQELEVPAEKVEWMLSVARKPWSLERPIGADGDSEFGEFIESEALGIDPTEGGEQGALRGDLKIVLESLPPREKRVLELRYGLVDGKPRTLKEVGKKFGVTRERIRQIEREALERLRNPRRAGKLREYLK